MKRNAFIMHLHPGCAGEYKKRHDEIWPALKEELHRAGVRNYSIYLDAPSNTLFAYQELTDDASDNELPGKDVVKKWWRMMKDIMDANPDESPVADPLREVFHLD
ncbi:MAG: L-rhamnose mutarotase [Treponema sp.]|jgi:L-rhamnose mutarotase|nr:L-rhamnose mutarotase [Treponema sp.]